VVVTHRKGASMSASKKTLMIDMDEVLANFSSSHRLADWDGSFNPPAMYEKGFFEELEPLPGAIKAVIKLLNSNKFDIWILTQPVAKSSKSYAEKATWIWKHLSDLGDKIIMTQNKILVKGDILIDDSKKWKNFEGTFMHFKPEVPSFLMWEEIVTRLLSDEF